MSEKNKKEKKEKVIYVDDGHTIVDMTGVGGRTPRNNSTPSTFKDKWVTYWSAVRMMLLPMFVVIAVLIALYLLMYFSLG